MARRAPALKRVEGESDERLLIAAVQQLPADQRLVIVMRFAEQRTIREIAASLGRSEGAIKQLQLSGLQNLRARLDDRNG